MKVPLASVALSKSEIELVNQVLISRNLTMGAEVKRFEKLMCQYLGVKEFVMVNSGSSANLLMLEALLRPSRSNPLLKPGDNVLVPAIAWPTTIWPIIQLGLNPIFVDIDAKSLALDLTKAQEKIDSLNVRVSAIFPIHPLGFAIPPSALNDFVGKNDLILINDVCESLGSWSESQHAGTSGIASSYSFYFSHHITTMEGGGIATDNSAFADDLRSMRSHGWVRDRSDVNFWLENNSQVDPKFLFVSTGYNVRPMEIQAVIGSSQITRIDDFVNRRRSIARMVVDAIAGTQFSVIGSETLSNVDSGRNHSWMLIPIYVSNGNASKMNRILEFLEQSEIETRPVLTGNFLAQPAIQKLEEFKISPKNFQVAQDITENAFLVGAHHDLTDQQVDFLCKTLKKATEVL
jgi:CDP-6-deoxy-D-xylo-4-hexulose-3-dehydrase